MAFNPNNYLVIGSDPKGSGDYFIHERKTTVDGKPGEVVTLADGKGDVKKVAERYIEEGFNPDKIIINGQPATDVFQKSGTQNNDEKAKRLQDAAKLGMLMVNPMAYMALAFTNPNFAYKLPNNNA